MCRESKANYLKIKIIYFTIYFSINLSSTICTSIPICIFNHYESVKQNKCGQPLGMKYWYPEEQLYQSDTMFPDSGSYDLAHRRMISCLSLFHKFYLNRDLPLSFLIPDDLPLVRATRFAERQHQYALCIPRCRTSQFKRTSLPTLLEEREPYRTL